MREKMAVLSGGHFLLLTCVYYPEKVMTNNKFICPFYYVGGQFDHNFDGLKPIFSV